MAILNGMMAIANFVWGWPILILTVFVALILSLKLGFFQFTMFGHALKNTFGSIFKKSEKVGEGTVSPFAACCAALASTLGVGNIAGVSVAIALGGPGAIFWMWAVALLGFIVKFSEITLGMAYREYDEATKTWHGGFYWYVKNGLGKNFKWLGIAWALIMTVAMLFAPAVQANSVASSAKSAFDVPGWIIGVIFAVLMMFVLIGGMRSLASFAEKIVPLMSIVYIVASIFVIVKYADAIPHVFAMIFKYAFTPSGATGGFAGSTVMLALRWGLARGVYSNEAGTGMAALSHSASNADHPVKQGLWGISEVFLDTIIVCTMTALVVLCSGVWNCGESGATLTAMAFGKAFGNQYAGTIFVTVVISFFAFTTVVVNTYYGEVCGSILGGKNFILPYRIAVCIAIIIGAAGGLTQIWNLYDFFSGAYVLCNLIALIFLGNKVFVLVKDYRERLKTGKWESSSREVVEKIPALRWKE